MAADKKPGPDAVASDVTFDPAVAWFQKRLGMTRAQVNRLTLDARRKVFFVTGLSDLEVIKSVQDSLARAIENGSTFEEWKKEVKEKKLFQGPEFTHRRLETIFRTNMQNAFATGRYMEMTAPAVLKRRPYWRFSAVRDGRTTKVCAAAHGTILPANHPWWKTHIPPLHFNCRSTFVPMTEKDAKAAGITKTPTELNSALGFGNPPDGVPAAAKDMPTEEEQKAKDAEAAKVRDEIEKAKAASAESTQANRQLTAARNERKEAEKAIRKASGNEIGPASDRLIEAQRQEEAARRKAEAKKQKKEQAEENARKATDKGAPRNWEPTEKEVKRRFRKYGEDYAEMMQELKKARQTTKNGRPAFEIIMPNGGSIIIQEGDLIREKLEEYIRAKRQSKGVRVGSPAPNTSPDSKKAKQTQKSNDPQKGSGAEATKKKKKLNEENWRQLPQNIRDDVEAIANNTKTKEDGSKMENWRGCELLDKPEDVFLSLNRVNPNFEINDLNNPFTNNCPFCANTFEARMRGLDVEALPISENALLKMDEEWTTLYEHGREHLKIAKGKNTKQMRDFIERMMLAEPDGARFIIQIVWPGKGNTDGHVFNALKRKGHISYLDSQVGLGNGGASCSEYLDDFSLIDPPKFMRVDNLRFSSKIVECFKPATKKEKKK